MIGNGKSEIGNRKSEACFLIFVFYFLISGFWFPASAKPLVADLSQYRIDIDSSFNGTRLLLFGSRNETGDIVVAVRGPERNFTVRRKERVAGIWMNRRERRFDDIPLYYIVAASRPLADIHTDLLKTLRIGLKETVLKDGAGDPDFANALIARLQNARLYSGEPQRVSFMGESLFKMVIPFPDSIPGGNYAADVYLFNDGALVGMQSIPIHVEKTGFDAWVYDFAQVHSVLYGMLAVLLAVGIGWSANSLMRRV